MEKDFVNSLARELILGGADNSFFLFKGNYCLCPWYCSFSKLLSDFYLLVNSGD
jgi:hypothetical protein